MRICFECVSCFHYGEGVYCTHGSSEVDEVICEEDFESPEFREWLKSHEIPSVVDECGNFKTWESENENDDR